MKNILCVKSIMTIMFSAMLCVMVYLYPEDYGDVFKNIAVMVATFYFSYQTKKGDAVNGRVDVQRRSDSHSAVSITGDIIDDCNVGNAGDSENKRKEEEE